MKGGHHKKVPQSAKVDEGTEEAKRLLERLLKQCETGKCQWSRESLVRRLLILCMAEKDPAMQQALRDRCERDICFFTDTFVYQFNPKKKGHDRVGPFDLWDFQREALIARPETHGKKGILWCYEHNRSAVVEKSREMGASWLFLIMQVWLCIFFEWMQFLNISKSADAVDCASPDSLFWKIRFINQHLPDWLRGEVLDQKLHLEYKATKSVIGGEASTGRAGVGGRASVIFIDEFSQIREAVEVRQRTANTSDVRFFNGTHLGTDTEFNRLCESPEMVKIQMHWSEHPDKKKGLYRWNQAFNRPDVVDHKFKFPLDFKFIRDGSPVGGPYPGLRSPWYDLKCHDIGSTRGVAMELDINPTGSVSQFFDPLVIRELVECYCQPPVWEGDLRFDHDSGAFLGIEPVQGGPLKLWVRPDSEGYPPAGHYVVGGDLSHGTGSSNSCLSVMNAETGERVGEYVTPFVDPLGMAPRAVALCKMFRAPGGEGAQLCWEYPGPGEAFGKKVRELGYGNLWYKEGHRLRPASSIPGWASTHRSKDTLLSEYRTALRERKCLNRSKQAMAETLRFHYTANGIEHTAQRGAEDPSGAHSNHGDRCMADAICWMQAKRWWKGKEKRVVSTEPEVGSMAWRMKLAERQVNEEERWEEARW